MTHTTACIIQKATTNSCNLYTRLYDENPDSSAIKPTFTTSEIVFENEDEKYTGFESITRKFGIWVTGLSITEIAYVEVIAYLILNNDDGTTEIVAYSNPAFIKSCGMGPSELNYGETTIDMRHKVSYSYNKTLLLEKFESGKLSLKWEAQIVKSESPSTITNENIIYDTKYFSDTISVTYTELTSSSQPEINNIYLTRGKCDWNNQLDENGNYENATFGEIDSSAVYSFIPDIEGDEIRLSYLTTIPTSSTLFTDTDQVELVFSLNNTVYTAEGYSPWLEAATITGTVSDFNMNKIQEKYYLYFFMPGGEIQPLDKLFPYYCRADLKINDVVYDTRYFIFNSNMPIHISEENGSIGFGGPADYEGTITNYWDTYLNRKIILSPFSYGTSLPETGEIGQIFFLVSDT